jgi:hypothetical protein
MESVPEGSVSESEISERRQRFKRLAENRTNMVLEKIRILSHCANRYAYEYTQADIDLIFGTIEDELKRTKTKFVGEQRPRFRLGGDR